MRVNRLRHPKTKASLVVEFARIPTARRKSGNSGEPHYQRTDSELASRLSYYTAFTTERAKA